MKEITINSDNLKDEEISNTIVRKKYVIRNSNGDFLLNRNHGTYEFINDLNIDDNLLLLDKKYIKDYPFFGDNTLYLTYYYLVISDDYNYEAISSEDIINVLSDNKYDNPRNNKLTEEMIFVVNYLLNGN